MKYFIIMIGFIVLCTEAIAQDSIVHIRNNQLVVKEQVRFMSNGEKNAFLVTIENTSLKMVTNVWGKYLKQFKGKIKTDKKTKEIFSDNSILPEISANTIDIYARFGETAGKKIDCYVWFDLGGGYLNSTNYPEKAQNASNMLGEFSRLVAKEEAIVLLELEEKELKRLEQDLKKLEKERETYLKKIFDANELIAKMNANLELNANSQLMKQDEIKFQKKEVDLAKDNVQSYN